MPVLFDPAYQPANGITILSMFPPGLVTQPVIGIVFHQHHFPDNLLATALKWQLVKIKSLYEPKLLIRGDLNRVIQPEGIDPADFCRLITTRVSEGVEPILHGVLPDPAG